MSRTPWRKFCSKDLWSSAVSWHEMVKCFLLEYIAIRWLEQASYPVTSFRICSLYDSPTLFVYPPLTIHQKRRISRNSQFPGMLSISYPWPVWWVVKSFVFMVVWEMVVGTWMIYAWCDVPYLGTSWDAPSYAGCITSCGPIPLRPRNNMALTDSNAMHHFFLLKKHLDNTTKARFWEGNTKCKRPQRNNGLQRIQWVFRWFSLLLKKTPLTPGRPGTTLRWRVGSSVWSSWKS